MVRLALAPLLLSALAVLPSSLAASSSPRLAKRQAETVALAALTSGPVTYVSYVSTTCTARCAAMVSSATACTEDECACAASAQAVTCMNCVLESATTAQGTTVSNGFETYAQACVDEGYLGAVPELTEPVTPTSSSGVASSSAASSSLSATATSPAISATSTAGYAAFSSWVTAVGTAVCTTECSPALNAFATCTATDTCICTATNFAYGQTCEDCLNLNEDGYWTTANLRQIASLWSAAGAACNVAVTTTAATTARTTASTTARTTASSSRSNTLSPETSGVPQQSYYAPTATTSSSSTAGGGGRSSAQQTGSSGGTSAGKREVGAGAGSLVGAAALGWAALVVLA